MCIRQNGRRKSNLDAFVAVQERSINAPNAAIGPSPVQRRAASRRHQRIPHLAHSLSHNHHNLIHHRTGMVHSVSGWTRGVQVKLWDPLRTRAYLSALEVCSRRGAIQIHVYLTLPYHPSKDHCYSSLMCPIDEHSTPLIVTVWWCLVPTALSDCQLSVTVTSRLLNHVSITVCLTTLSSQSHRHPSAVYLKDVASSNHVLWTICVLLMLWHFNGPRSSRCCVDH